MTLAGEVGHPAQSFGQRRELKPTVERRLKPGRVQLLIGVQRRFLAAGLSQRLFQLGPAGQRGRLVRLAAFQRSRGPDEVVRQQPEPGVPQVRLDRRGPAGDGRLPAQRPEAAAQFAGEVHQPGQVGLHGLQLAEGLLLAPPVLEYARGLLDQRAARLGPGVQHLVELALADDHVHFPAQARVGEQFGDIEEPALVPVDGVLALAGPEEQAADGHFCVVDRERAIGVVDGEGDLGTAERRPGGGAGEDDVVHLAAAQALGALLAHHPGERVHDVRFARPVRPDHAGDTWLEPQRGGRGEGLEPTQGEAFHIHPRALLPSAHGPSGLEALGRPAFPHLTASGRRFRRFAPCRAAVPRRGSGVTRAQRAPVPGQTKEGRRLAASLVPSKLSRQVR